MHSLVPTSGWTNWNTCTIFDSTLTQINVVVLPLKPCKGLGIPYATKKKNWKIFNFCDPHIQIDLLIVSRSTPRMNSTWTQALSSLHK